MSSNWFPTKLYCFHECLLTQFWLFALNISVHTETEHQGNRYPAARNSASPSETLTQQLNTPGTVTILQGVSSFIGILLSQISSMHICIDPLNVGVTLGPPKIYRFASSWWLQMTWPYRHQDMKNLHANANITLIETHGACDKTCIFC